MLSNNEYVENSSPSQDRLSMIYHFPYKELQNIQGRDIEQMRASLIYLLKITSVDLFYTNTISIRYTFEFVTNALLTYEDGFPKDVFLNLLAVFKNIITNLSARGNLFELFPTLDVFEICRHLSEFNLFGADCASQCVPIMLTVLKSKPNFNYYCSLDKIIIKILENFRFMRATNEVNIVLGFIMLKFPLESQALQTCANWLLEDTADVLKNLHVDEKIDINSPVSACIQNVTTFFLKVRGSLKASLELKKYQEFVDKFLIILLKAAPQLIKICCVESVALHAKPLLALVLQEFLSEQGILSEEIESITQEDIHQFPANINEWSKTFTRTFFWLCHLLYYNKKFVWSTTEIVEALNRFMYTKKYMKLMNVNLLKSICFIYPILLQGKKIQKHKLFTIGNDLLIVASNYIPLFHRILSLSKFQLFWFLYKGSYVIKKITLKYWLDKIPDEKIPTMRQMVIDTKTELVLLDIFIIALKTKSATIGRIAQIIQSLHNMKLFKEIQGLIPKFRDNSDAVVAIIQACCVEIPVENKALAANIFASICQTLDINPSHEVFVSLCQYAVNVLKVLKTEEKLIDSICNNQFLIRTLISRLDLDNDLVTLAVLKFLTTLLKYQKKACYSPENNVVVDLKRLLTASSEVIAATIGFVTKLLGGKLSISLKDENVPIILYVLFDLTNSYLSDEAYDCLFQILKSYHAPSHSYGSGDVINAPVLGMLIEERCHFLNRKRQSATFLKFVLYWIKRMRLNPNKSICYLPKKHILVSYIKRSTVLSEPRVLRYTQYISEIYAEDDQLDTGIEDNLSLSLICRFNSDD